MENNFKSTGDEGGTPAREFANLCHKVLGTPCIPGFMDNDLAASGIEGP